MRESQYPILEFDDTRQAVINPSSCNIKQLESEKLVITFFPEVIETLILEKKITHETTIP